MAVEGFVDPGYATTCVGDADGAVACTDEAGALAPLEVQFGPIRAVASGENHTCATDVDGVVRCWGQGFGIGDGEAYAYTARPVVLARP